VTEHSDSRFANSQHFHQKIVYAPLLVKRSTNVHCAVTWRINMYLPEHTTT